MTTTINKSIRSVPFSDKLKDEWDQFVEKDAINSTFLHSRKFYDHNPLNGKEDASLLFYQDTRILAIFPAVLYYKNEHLILHSHLRATYGGIVLSKDVGVETALELIKSIIQFAKEKKAEQIIVRNPFRIFHTNLCDETDYAMWFYGFKIKSRELEMAIPLFSEISKTKSQYHSDVARNVKKALKCLHVSELHDLEEFWFLLEKSLLDKHGIRPVHDYESIKKMMELVGEQKFLCLGTYFGQTLIGGCVVFLANNKVLHGQYIAARKEYMYLMPNHALIDHLIEYGCNRGFQYLNLGMANEDEGRIANYGLFSFKEHFGARGVLRETMYLDL